MLLAYVTLAHLLIIVLALTEVDSSALNELAGS
jgi:hypothetical protein